MGEGAPTSQNPNQQEHSAEVPAQASDHPADSRPQQAQLHSCLRRARRPQAASVCSRKRVHYADDLPPLPKRARREAPPAGPMRPPAAASAATAAQQGSPLPDRWTGDAAPERASADRRRESEEAYLLRCGAEDHNDPLMWEEGWGGALWAHAAMLQAEQGVTGSSSDLPAALHAGHGVGWAGAGGHPAAPAVGGLQAHQSTSAGLLAPHQPEPELEADVGMEVEHPSEMEAMLSCDIDSDIYDLMEGWP